MSSKFKVLSIDGGGIRGLVAAVWLARLEEKLSKPLYKHFDLIAGTSTGSLLACGIAKGIKASDMVTLYRDRGKQIFPSTLSRLWSRTTRLFSDGTSAPKYDGIGLDAVLQDVFGNTTFGRLKSPTLVTAYDTFGRRAIVFKSSKADHEGLRIWDVCRASCSAPSYFPAHVMDLNGAPNVPLIDGGVVANNPTACAIAEAAKIGSSKSSKQFGLQDIVVASFGTGELVRPIGPDQASGWGALEWAVPLIDVLFDGSADSVNYIATQLLDKNHYFRFQTQLQEAYDDLDNADATNLSALQRLAAHYLTGLGGDDLLDELVERIG